MQPERLKKRQDFINVANQGQKVITSGLILQFMKAPEADAFKLGFTVTKKVGGAVVRNRVRRRLKAAAQRCFEKAPRGYYYVLVGRTSTITRAFSDLEKDMRYAVGKVGAGKPK